MSAFHHAYANHSPPAMKKSAAVKAARSTSAFPPYKPSKKTPKAPKPIKPEADVEEEPLDFEDDDMATSFLQYCAMCEKQILVPNSSFLYCSEQCRRMDALPSSQRPNSYASLSSSFRTKQRRPTIMDSLAHSLPRYIPALQPTPRPRVDARIPPTQHDAKTDLDPTEWKPADLSDPDDDRGTQNVIPKKQTDHAHRPDHSASHPEALLYLSRNHHTAAHGRKSGISVVATLPSLSHASTATASSTSSSATDLSEAAYSPELILPAQVHVPATSVSNVGVEGLSLDGDNHLRYEKRAVRSRKIESAASGSLKKLLAGENEGRM